MIERDLVATADAVESREDFVSFVQALLVDLHEHPDEWENRDLESFLESMARWVTDMDGYYKGVGQRPKKDLDWKSLADILMAATSYE